MQIYATLYASGDGVEPDMDEARKWLQKAAELGDEEAKEWLEKL